MKRYIWGRHQGLPGDAGRWGVIKPLHLNSDAIPDDLEVIAQRYRDAYPEQQFVVSERKPAEGAT